MSPSLAGCTTIGTFCEVICVPNVIPGGVVHSGFPVRAANAVRGESWSGTVLPGTDDGPAAASACRSRSFGISLFLTGERDSTIARVVSAEPVLPTSVPVQRFPIPAAELPVHVTVRVLCSGGTVGSVGAVIRA